MNIKNHPLFISIALILFFPIGLIFLLLSDQSPKRKWLMGSIGLILFASILSLSFLFPPNGANIDDFDIIVTRDTLTVGQSGGLLISNDERYITDYTITSESDILLVNDNIYTAQRVGTSCLTISSNGIRKSVEIHVIEGESTLETVYASTSGKRYHKVKSHAGKNAIDLTEEDALQSNKTPCSICYK